MQKYFYRLINRLTLAQKFLIPLLLSWALLQVCIFLWVMMDLRKNTLERVEERSTALVKSVNLAVSTAVVSDAVQQVVDDIANEDDVRSVLIVTGQPLKIVASSDKKISQKYLIHSEHALLKTQIHSALAAKRTIFQYDHHERHAELVWPVMLNHRDLSLGGVDKRGVVVMNMDTRSLYLAQEERAWQFLAVMIIASTMGTLIIWALLRWFVLAPTREISKTLTLRNNGYSSARVKSYGNDEISWLIRILNNMFDELERQDAARKVAENKMQSAIQLANTAAQAKSDFLAVMSHEIRTPMNGVIGMVQVLKKTGLNEKQIKLVLSISQSSQILMAILNDVLDFSKLDANKLLLESIPFSIKHMLEQVHYNFSPEAERKKLSLKLTSPDEDLWVKGDQTRITQVVNNLLSNAIKFTRKGSVEFTTSVLPLDGERVMLQLKVKDSGVGMTPQQQEKIFQPFTQADSSTTRQYGGTGLGLVICKRLIDLMGGTLQLSSVHGLGTEFLVEIPLRVAEAPAVTENPWYSSAGMTGTLKTAHILLADDVLVNQEVATYILQGVGYSVTAVHNGIEVLRHLQQQGNEVDLILMDCLMPEMDGYETARKIRELEKNGNRHIPIIALTASAMTEVREKCLAAGMDEFVSKPFDEVELLRKINRCLQPTSPVVNHFLLPSTTVEPPAPPLKKSTEDHVMDHTILDDLFKRFGPEKGKILLEKFLDAMDESSRNLQVAFVEKDNQVMHRMVHNLKSTCANVGATEARQMAIKIEDVLKRCMEESSIIFSDEESIRSLLFEVDKAKNSILELRS